MIVLDTHALIWLDSGDRRLGRSARALADAHLARGTLNVSSITFWEVGLLLERGRIGLPVSLPEWRDRLLRAGLAELPLDGRVALRSLELAGLPEDPSDRFIAATALVNGATLVTADERLLTWSGTLARHDARR